MNGASGLLACHDAARTAIECDGAAISFGELRDRVARAAGAWRARGLQAGQPVAVKLPDGIDWAVAWLSAVWAGGSFRAAGQGQPARIFAAGEVQFSALAFWSSPATRARYPVRWRVQTPAGEFEVQALVDAQELDSRSSTGTVYWEGLSELRRNGQRVGAGYLEMTGYVAPLQL